MQTDTLSLTALVDALREKGFDIKSSKIQYYKDLGLIKPVGEFAQFNTYSFKDVFHTLKRIEEWKKSGYTLKAIAKELK